jgi:hypothetical protein
MINRKKFIKLVSANTTGIILLNRLPLNAIAKFNNNPASFSDRMKLPVGATTDPLHANLFDAIDKFTIIQNDNPDHLLIITHEINNDIIDHLPKERDVAIYCYKATFASGSVVHLDGRNFFLLSNKVNFQNTTINTQPAIAQDANPLQQTQLDGLVANRSNIPAPAGEDFAIDKGTLKKSSHPINGRNGGDITISCLSAAGDVVLISTGGDGGKGQNGAPGRNGADDRNLHDIKFFDPVKRPTEGMIDGFPGEIGGAGALGGFGGNGGNQNLMLAGNNIVKLVSPGGGRQGESGDPGPSGKGGIGISHVITGFSSGPGNKEHQPGDKKYAIYRDDDVPSLGQNVAGVKPSNTQERNGNSGHVSITTIDDFYRFIPVEFGRLLLLKAESLYMNSSFKANDPNINEAYDLFSFVYTLSANNPGSAFKGDGGGSGTGEQSTVWKGSLFYLSDYKTDRAQWEFIKQKCSSYIHQIRLNLDFFGNPPNYAPELAYDFLADNFLANYPLIKDFGAYARQIADEKQGLRKEMFNAENYVKQSNFNLANLTSKIADFKKSILELNAELQDRFATIENLKIKLSVDEADLQKAIQDMGGCSFDIAFKCLMAVAAIVAAVYTAGAATGPAVVAVGSVISGLEAVKNLADLKKALNDDKSVIRQGAKNVSDQMAVIGDDYDKVKKNVRVIQDAFKEKDAPNVAIPDYLICVDTKKFDDTIDKIIDDPNLSDRAKSQAARYKHDYHYFTDFVMVTNQKRLEITSDVLGISQAYHEMELQQQQIDRYNETILNNTISLTAKQDLFEMYYRIVSHASYLIYLQNKALAYQYPANADNGDDNQFDNWNLTQLGLNAFTANWNYILHFNDPKSSLRRPKSTLNPLVIEFIQHDASNLNKVRNVNYVSNLSLQDFKRPLRDEQGDTYFSLHFDILPTKLNHSYIFLGGYNIKVRGLVFFFKSKTMQHDELSFKLTHLGNSIVTKDKDLNQIQFFEQPRTTVLYAKVSPHQQPKPSFEIAMGDSTHPQTNLIDGTSSGLIAQLGRSPFASWRLDIPKGFNTLSETDLQRLIADLTNIEIYFYYTYQQG